MKPWEKYQQAEGGQTAKPWEKYGSPEESPSPEPAVSMPLTVEQAEKNVGAFDGTDLNIMGDGGVLDKVKTAAYGLQDMLFLGADDEINAGIQTAKDWITGEDNGTYGEKQKAFADGKKQLQEDNPAAYATGQGLSMFTGYGAVKAVPAMAEYAMGNAIKTGGMTGATYGYNSGDNTEENPNDRLEGAAIGGVVGTALPAAMVGAGHIPKVVKDTLSFEKFTPTTEAEKRLLGKVKAKVDASDMDTASLQEATKAVNSTDSQINKDLVTVIDLKKKEMSPEGTAYVKRILSNARNKTEFISDDEIEQAAKYIGGTEGKAFKSLAQEKNVVTKHFANQQDIAPSGFLGTLADDASAPVSKGGLANLVGRLSPVRKMLVKSVEPQNKINQGLKQVEAVDGFSDTIQPLIRNAQLRSSLGIDPKTVETSAKGVELAKKAQQGNALRTVQNNAQKMKGSIIDDDNWPTLERTLAPHWEELKGAKAVGKGSIARLAKEIETPNDFRNALRETVESKQPLSYVNKQGEYHTFIPDETDINRALSNVKAKNFGDEVEPRALAFYGAVADVAKRPALMNKAKSTATKKLIAKKAKAKAKAKHHKSPIGGRIFREQLNNGNLYGRNKR